jgi:hypothetical protein
MTDCPICRLPLKAGPVEGNFDCDRCGRFGIITEGATLSLATLLNDPVPNQRRRRANLSHKVRRRTREGEASVGVPMKVEELQKWGLDDPLPTPGELLDELVLWVGDRAAAFTDAAEVTNKAQLAAWLGLPLDVDPDHPDRAFDWLLRHVDDYVRIPRMNPPLVLELTWDGWLRFDELKRQETTSFTAFMAMKFGDPALDAVVDDHFKPAVAATAFTLKRVTDGQGAGLIDDQMRVALRTSRFVISDLTHNSRGAYWEAGFAEGLGKPVIYTCRKDQWDKERTHFDANHLVTIVWDPANLRRAASDLKATIRATLPDVAKMTD